MGGTPARFRGKVVLEEFSAVTGNKGAVPLRRRRRSSSSTSLLICPLSSMVTDRAQAVYLSSSFVLGLLNRSLGFVGLLKSIFLTACDVDGALNLENLKEDQSVLEKLLDILHMSLGSSNIYNICNFMDLQTVQRMARVDP
ncbi:hypothetical protein Bca101_083035 [Brassica carinata]